MGNEKKLREKELGDNLHPCAVHLRPAPGHGEELGEVVFTTTEVCLVFLVSDLNGRQKTHTDFDEPKVLSLTVRVAVKKLGNGNICYVALQVLWCHSLWTSCPVVASLLGTSHCLQAPALGHVEPADWKRHS